MNWIFATAVLLFVLFWISLFPEAFEGPRYTTKGLPSMQRGIEARLSPGPLVQWRKHLLPSREGGVLEILQRIDARPKNDSVRDRGSTVESMRCPMQLTSLT